MSIEQLLAENTAALNANTETMGKLIAGREAALAQFEKQAAVAGEAPKPTRTRKPKADEAPAAGGGGEAGGNAAGSAAAGSTVESPAASPSSAPTVGPDDAEIRAAAATYIKGASDDEDARQARGANLKAITDHFGTKTLVGPEGVQDADQRQQTLFFIKRFDAGCPVDFSQEYDFSGDPTQDGLEPAAAAAAGDEFDIG